MAKKRRQQNNDKRLQDKIDQIMQRQTAERSKVAVERVDCPNDDLPISSRIVRSLGWCVWFVAAWFLSSLIVSFMVVLLRRTSQINLLATTSGSAVIQVIQLILLLIIVVGVPYRHGLAKELSVAKRRAAEMRILGISRLPGLKDLLPILLNVVVYYVAALIVSCFVRLFIPDGIMTQAQNVGFATIGNNWLEIVMIMIVLVLITPIFEELIFRGFLLGKIQLLLGFWPAAIIVSLVFAVAHGQINAAIVTFVLSMVACYSRHKTGAVWAGIALHAISNLVAASLVFVLPMLA